MKFMKLGSRPDTFRTAEPSVRSVSSEVSGDLIVEVKGTRYSLHKFPLLSKCLRLQRLCSEAPAGEILRLPDFPGGGEAFELCAKFCYGIAITLSAHNIVSTRCAAEYLQMTEDVDKGNLIFKIDVFFNSCILNGWRDSLVALQTTKSFPVWAEDLAITARCIDSVASKILARPARVRLDQSCSRRDGGSQSQKLKGWWAEDLAELGIDLYWRTMVALKSGGKIAPSLIGDALRIYASRWLPDISKYDKRADDPDIRKHRLLLESVVSLLPGERGGVSCSFLLKLLKAGNTLRASSSTKQELARRAGLQLDEASVGDLLIPSAAGGNTVYDVDVVTAMLEQFMVQGQSPATSPGRAKGEFQRRRSRSAENVDIMFEERRRSSSASHGSRLKVAKIVDGYLQKIAKDRNLAMAKFIAIAESIPEFARLDHDHLYKAIDIYLKGHPELNKTERKRICRPLDCKKLSVEACMHATQNEMLPLRVVVQVLFFEQARAATSGGPVTVLPGNIKALLAVHKNSSKASSTTNGAPEDRWSVSGLKSTKQSIPSLKMKLRDEDDDDLSGVFPKGSEKPSKVKAISSTTPNRSKRMFSKLWAINRSASERN